MRRHAPIAALLLAAAVMTGSADGAAPPPAPPPEPLATLLDWLPGEYSNHEQHWQQATVEQRADPVGWVGHVFTPVVAARVGPQLMHVVQFRGNDRSAVFRRRLYAFEPDAAAGIVRQRVFRFRDEAAWSAEAPDAARLAELTPAALERLDGCDVVWRRDGEQLVGSMREDACRVTLPGFDGVQIVNDRFVLGPDTLTTRPSARPAAAGADGAARGGVELTSRKVRYFTGWAAIKRGGPSAPAASRDWIGMRGIVLHNEGERVPVRDDAGQPLGYSIELARLTYQNTRTPILKFGVIDDATGKTIAYSWTEPLGARIGINLGWFQAGVTLKAERSQFRD